jgi:uncharacterized protein YbjQ (UPF0145 family)
MTYLSTSWRVWRNLELLDFTQALYDDRELAMARMQHEAKELSAEGIVGVQLQEHHHGWGGRAIEFFAIGTAIQRVTGAPAAKAQAPTPVISVND